MLEKRKQTLAENAAPHLEQGETVKGLLMGQTFVSPLLYLLIGPIVFVFMVRPRVVMVTERNVYVFQQHYWKVKQLDRLVTKHPIGSVDVQLSTFGLKVGDSDKVYALLGQFGDMKQVAALAGAEGSARAAPGPEGQA